MEPSIALFDTVLSPTAIYCDTVAWEEDDASATPAPSWDDSQLNPKNRINSLAPVTSPTWRLDGVDRSGTVFFALPWFALGESPLRIDVHIPSQREHPRHLRTAMRSGSALLLQGQGAAQLGISQHVLRALERWSGRMPDFRGKYRQMPFGSRVVIDSITADIRDMGVHLVPNYDVEQQWYPLEQLQDMWTDIPWETWPEVVDWKEVRLERQLDEAVSLVQLPSRHGTETLVFKSLVRDRKYLYHELRTLLTLLPQPSIIPGPLYVVKKKCRFGGKLGVCGFILPYYPDGTLRDALTPQSSLADRFRWARQVTDALVHIHESTAGFHPDLRPDTVLVARRDPSDPKSPQDAVLADLEQRGGWYAWTPPEVRYIEYMEQIATVARCPPVRMEAAALLRAHIPRWKAPSQVDRYSYSPKVSNSNGGFNAAWLSLRDFRAREAAQVFMLGKLLWCVFEGMGSVNCAISAEMLRDEIPAADAPQFPDFRSTPEILRAVIRACTSGAPEWDGRRRSITRWGERLVPAECIGPASASATAADTQVAARAWWREEVRCAKAYLTKLSQKAPEDEINAMTGAGGRPTLAEVLGDIRRAEEECLGQGEG
ncbi:U-box domain-containing protein 33 [Pleurostoma richardsiae]|uniref:U-box domain-containing protein 33 n=1 Tax=Pleurostoma richardsiae TaxID=41990 RepID=A0AA38S301_9PEZI|nr:U-box domain-containing protein 33 [Pleurostoma richardsiae]